MADAFYPRQVFALHTPTKAELDYLALVRFVPDLRARIAALEAAVEALGGNVDTLDIALLTEAGDFFLTETGDQLIMEAA